MAVQNEQWTRMKEIFEQARELPLAGRVAFMDGACRADLDVRDGVEALLAAHDDAGRFLSSPTVGIGAFATPPDEAELFVRLQRALAGRFSLERELGRGGMGIVFLARDVALDRPVAIKLLPPTSAAIPEHRARFLREARTAAGLSHPNVVAIHGVEEQGDLVYFIMALVEGESLAERVRRAGPLNPADAARLVQEVAWALGYAHSRGVIHRDIKPDNILLDRATGRALVTDFGIARIMTTATMSHHGEVMGTLRYMSPEQASGEAVDGRSDLYSLGVTAFFALAGRLPFESPNASALLAMHLGQAAPPLRSVNPTVPVRLATAIDSCLAKEPASRFPSGEALADAVGAAQIVRAEIAPSIREFLASARTGAAQAVGLGCVWFAMLEAASRIAPRGPMMGHPLDPAFAILSGTTFIVFLLPVLAARGVLRAGLNQEDVARAVVTSSLARDSNVDYRLARAERVTRVLRHPAARVLFVALTGILVWWMGTRGIVPSLRDGQTGRAAALILNAIANSSFLLAIAIIPARIVAVFTSGTAAHASALRRIWRGGLGRWLFRIAGTGLARPSSTRVAAEAPTETVLGHAVAALFEQLPADLRSRLGDVPAVIGALERAAAALRARRDELLAAGIDEARVPAEERLRAAVSALEKLRLDMLRLRAGVGHPDDLTASVEEARLIGRAVDLELAAAGEVRSLVPTSLP